MANRFRFSLKSLVVVVSFAAVLFGWWSDHWRLRQRIEKLENPPRLIQDFIQSGQMAAPLSPPSGMARFRAAKADAPGQADVNTEASDR
jgi:hypothetical protein